jgi:hypothetical protein
MLAPQSGILVIDRLGIGLAENGRWRSMDSIYSKSWPKQLIPSATVDRFTEGTCYELGERGNVQSTTGLLEFKGDDSGPYDRGWILKEGSGHDDHVLWFGPKPTAPSVTYAAGNSATYVSAVKSYLQAKGMKNAKLILHTVALADLDGNGTREALIFASSRPNDGMHGPTTLSGETKFPKDFSVVLIRYISGKTVKTATVYYTDGRKGSLEGHCTFAGLWDLDGKPGLEILYRWTGYEASAASIVGFAKGKSTVLAEAGDGV